MQNMDPSIRVQFFPEFCNVQPTAISRWKHKHGGKGTSTSGRRPKVAPSSSQSVDIDGDQSVFQALTPKKQKATKKVHSLKASVDANQSAMRKH